LFLNGVSPIESSTTGLLMTELLIIGLLIIRLFTFRLTTFRLLDYYITLDLDYNAIYLDSIIFSLFIFLYYSIIFNTYSLLHYGHLEPTNY